MTGKTFPSKGRGTLFTESDGKYVPYLYILVYTKKVITNTIMNKLRFLPLAALMGAFAMTACDNDDNRNDGVGPQFADVTFAPNPCYAGDTITATLSYSSKGKNWYAARFKWTATSADSTYSGKTDRIPDPLKYGSTYRMKAPTHPGTYTVSVNASYEYTTGGPQGQLFGQSNSVTGQLVVKEASIASAD